MLRAVHVRLEPLHDDLDRQRRMSVTDRRSRATVDRFSSSRESGERASLPVTLARLSEHVGIVWKRLADRPRKRDRPARRSADEDTEHRSRHRRSSVAVSLQGEREVKARALDILDGERACTCIV